MAYHFCPNCGAAWDNYKFCGHCGSPEPATSVLSSAVVAPRSRHGLNLWTVVIILVALGCGFIALGVKDVMDQSNQPPTVMSQEEKTKLGCKILGSDLRGKPVSQLSIDQMRQLQICEALGY